MNGDDIKIFSYPKEHYNVIFNRSTGFMIRKEYKGYDEPKSSKHGPELLDISITNYCSKNCSFCYKNSHIFGKEMSFMDYSKIITEAEKNDVMQIALGGGNPNEHSRFIDILKCTHDHGIVPNYTSNGLGISQAIISATKKFCGCIAISYYEPEQEFRDIIIRLIGEGIKCNVHFLLTASTIKTAIMWIQQLPDYLKGINAFIFLNYKPMGRNHTFNQIPAEDLEKFFNVISKNPNNVKIGFDSCSISGIITHMHIPNVLLECCEAARFSAYISEDMRMYPCSFMIEHYRGGDMKEKSMLDIWNNDTDFIRFRELPVNAHCNNCPYLNTCNGGCKIFPNINYCNSHI